MTRRRPLVAGGIASCLALAGSLAFGAVPAPAAPNLTQVTFQPTGASATWSVPTGVRSVLVSMAGGSGGSVQNSGFQYASTLTGTLTIPTGATSLQVNVGGAGSPPGFDGAGGWNGGGSAGSGAASTQAGGGGGGATDLRLPGAPASQALMVAGGSGGSGGYGGGTGDFGGVGGVGALSPGSGARSAGGALLDAGGRGGAGGSVSGAVGGNGGSASGSNNGSGGGGGGGWASGAGGQAGGAFPDLGISIGGGGGGGGQSYADPAYVAGVAQSSPAAAHVTLSYLTVSVGTIPSPLEVGTFATWQYSAGSEVTYAIASGTLPPGLVLDSASGLVRGVPTAAGTYTFAVAASAYPDGTNPVTTEVSTTVQIGPGGTGSLVANSATNVGTTTATGNASAYAGGSTIQSLVCAYWLTAPTGNEQPAGYSTTTTPSTAQPNSTGAPTPVTCDFTGLTGNTTYFFQLLGEQASSGTLRSNTVSFTTGSTPAQPTTQPPSSVGTTSATGAGALSATQNVTAIACRVATTIAGVATGTSFTASPASTTGVVGNRPLTCSMTGLIPSTVYYYAFFATDAAGTAASPTIERFETRASPPFLGEISASSVAATTATITGSVTPTNEAVTSIACRVSPASGGILNGTFVAADPFQLPTSHAARTATCSLSGLAPSTAYRVRMEAVDRDGTGGSPVIAFTTAAAGGGGGGGGSEPAPAPSTPTAAPSPAPSPGPAPAPAPTAGPRLRTLLPGLALVLDPTPGTVSRTRAVPLRSRVEPRVTLRLGTPTSIVLRELPRSRSIALAVRAERGGPWRALPRARASSAGRAVVAPLEATRARTYLLRIGSPSGSPVIVRLSSR